MVAVIYYNVGRSLLKRTGLTGNRRAVGEVWNGTLSNSSSNGGLSARATGAGTEVAAALAAIIGEDRKYGARAS